MSGSYTYPGVYIQELPSPVHTINGVPTSVTVLVGAATSGPLNQPTPIFSVADYQRAFGSNSTLALDQAVSLFYQNGGGAAFIVRIGPATMVTATPVPAAGLPQIQAISPGAWGTNLTITTDQINVPAARIGSLFNLTVTLTTTDPATGIQEKTSERYVGIPIVASPARSLQGLIAGSNLIQYVAPAAAGGAAGATGATGAAEAGATGAAAAPGATGAAEAGATGAAAPAGATGAAVPAGAGATGATGAAVAPIPPPTPLGTFAFQQFGSPDPSLTDADLRGEPGAQTGFYAAAKNYTFFNLLVLTPVPGKIDVATTTLQLAAVFAQSQTAMLIADAPSTWATVTAATADRDTFFEPFGTERTNAALYFPRLQLTDAAGAIIENVGPAAAIAGLYALTDAQRGVWKAPAGIAAQLSGVTELEFVMSDGDNGLLNPVAVNCLRTLPTIGNVVWGARTMAGDDVSASQWKYVPIRRLALYIEASLYQGTQWVVFEPNDTPLWAQVRLNVGTFMQTLFRQGAFQGTTAKDAYFVKCDSDTNPQSDIDRGILNVIVGFAPLKPAEFVVIKIQQIVNQTGV